MSFFKKLFSDTDSPIENKSADFLVGDIFYTQTDDQFNLYKLLAIDTDPTCYHVLSYRPTKSLPAVTEIEKLPVFVYHSPFDKSAFAKATLLINKNVNAADLIGYHEYLRQTQTPNYYISIANNYYKAGFQLTTEKKLHEAIDAYSKAIDLFPQFFEAIDNRAFCKMDLGLFQDAIEDFKLSLQQNPNSLLAEFSLGECYFKLGDFENAKPKFEKAHNIDPNHPAPKQYLEKVNAVLNK